MVKTKLIIGGGNSNKTLDESINEFIKSLTSDGKYNLIDIKYQMIPILSNGYSCGIRYSALIIYNEVEK